MPWTVPGFVARVDPVEQATKTTVEEYNIGRNGWGFGKGGSFARVVRGVLDPEHCAELLAAVNSKGFTPALLNTGGGNQVLMPTERDGHRVIVDSPELAEWLLEVLRPHLPAQFGDGAALTDVNERLRVLCYTPGQFFAPHCDGQYTRPRGHPAAGDHSRVTIQLYLHDVPSTSGGATTFFPSSRSPVACQPVVGSVLLFTQDLEHEGSLLAAGVKYTLRTEAMFTPRGGRAHCTNGTASSASDSREEEGGGVDIDAI